jgi:hypothetical protein
MSEVEPEKGAGAIVAHYSSSVRSILKRAVYDFF